MNVRKQRTHQCGLSNIDFRTKGDTMQQERFNPTMKFADVGTMSKHGFKMTGGLAIVDPKEDTSLQFYNAQGKTAKAPVLVANKKSTQLEDTKWTDKVFTGDNARTTAKMVDEANKRDIAVNPNKRRGLSMAAGDGPAQRLEQAILKRQQDAANEPLTLEKTIDKKHIMDIRRALRRKYASRTNLHRIFNQWDRGNKSGISVNDLYHGLNKIGITSSLDQATALHACAIQTDNDPNLSLQEFSDLLFSNEEVFTANLKVIPATDKLEEEQLAKTVKSSMAPRTIDLGTLDQASLEKLRLRNKWRAVLQRSLQNITKDLLSGDEKKTYMAEPREMMRVLDHRMKLTTNMAQEKEELHEYLMMFQDEASGKIKYTEMAADLRSFDYNQETNEGIVPKSANSISSGRRSYFGALVQRNVFNDDLLVLDSQKVPANKLDVIERQLVKVNRFLQDKFKTQAEFEKYLRERVDTDKNGNISVDEMKTMIHETCGDEVVKRRLSKNDLEGFLSAFKYSTHGATDISAVAPLVFEKDSNKLTLALSSRVRANPPPKFVNEELGTTEATENISDEITARRLRGLLTKIEDAAFCSGKPRTFQIFRAFDTDGDGFVSYKDFEAHLVKNKIHASKPDIALLMKHVLDTDGNGYIDFSTFKEKFGPNMSKLVAVPENELHLPNLVPNKDKLNEYGKKSMTLRHSVDSVRKGFQPEIDAKLVPATRFGAKPAHPNSFLNHQPGPNTPGFLSEADRVGLRRSERNIQTKADFQADDKAKKQAIAASNLRAKQGNVERLQNRIQLYEQDQLAKQTQKMLTKAANYDTYEKLNHF